MSTSDKSELRVGKKVNCGLLKNFLVIFAIITILVAPITTASAITFDPAVTIPNPTPIAGEVFGQSVAISGTRVVVGALFDDATGLGAGSAYVYDCTPACGAPVKISNPTPASGDHFTESVAISGMRVVVGAPFDDTGGANAGAAYVYDCTLITCGAPVTIPNPTPAAGDNFGFSVAISGTRVVVSAAGDDTALLNAGAAYVYDCTLITCGAPVTILNPTPAGFDNFGGSVAISGTRVVVGASSDVTGGLSAGAAYVYDCTLITCGAPVTILNPTPASFDQFGGSVAISGMRVVVGAPEDDAGASNAGAAYVYECGVVACSVPITILNPTPAVFDKFGTSVAISGMRVVVGAQFDDTGVVNAGAAYVYDCTIIACSAPVTIQKTTPVSGDQFGFSVAISGTKVVVGAQFDDTGVVDAGAAYLFVESVAPIDTTPPTVTTTVSDNFITDADDPATFTVVSLFSEPMAVAPTPVITFTQDVADTLALTGGVWSTSNTVYTTSYSIDVDSQELVGVVAATTGARDVAGNPQDTDTSPAAARTFDIDTINPTVTTTVSDNFITDADDLNTFTVTSLFSEPMAVAPTPVITFTQDVTDTLTLTGGVWSTSNTVYTTSYSIDVDSQELVGVVAATTATKDAAGNAQNPDTSAPAARTFDVDTINPTKSSTVSDGLISDSDTGGSSTSITGDGTFSVTTTFSEPMDTSGAATPVIAFIPAVSTTLSFDSGSWNLAGTIYTAIYDVLDAGVTVPDVDVEVSGAKDLAGNLDPGTTADLFDVDTENPTASIAYLDGDLFPLDLYAKSGTTITFTATASEPLATSPSLSIGGANIAGPLVMTLVTPTEYTLVYVAGAGDGTATISLSVATDLAGNLIVSAPTPTGGADFFIDNTAPVGTLAIERTDAGVETERTYVRSVNLVISCTDPAAPSTIPVLGSGCDLVDITGTGLVGEASGDFEAISSPIAATLTIYRDDKPAAATYRDKAGNVAAPIPDTIALDPQIVGIAMDDGDVAADGNTPFWGVPVIFSGTVENFAPGDTITYAFGSPTKTLVAIDDGGTVDGVGTFSTTDSYLKPSEDLLLLIDNPHESSAKLVDSLGDVFDSTSTLVQTLGPVVTVQAHPTAITSDVINDPNQVSSFFVGGRLSDTLFSVPVTGKLITFANTGAPPPPDVLDPYTTEGITFTDTDLDGIVIDSCISCLPLFPDNIMRLNAGAKIFPPEGTVYALLRLQDMGSESVTFRVTNGESPPAIDEFTRAASVSEIIALSLTDPFEVVEIEILSVTGSGTVGLSSVMTIGSQLGVINDVDFTTQTTGLTTSLAFDASRFYAEGTAQTEVAEFLPLDEIFGGDVDYVTTTTTVTYSVLPLPSAGIGGSAVPVPDGGVGFYGILCPGGTDDDKDALCNGWEASGANAGSGVPFTVAGLAQQYYPLPGTSTTTNNTLVEIDYMVPHTPLDSALTLAATAFSDQGVTLIDTLGDEIPHQYSTKLWGDTDDVDNNDFNSLKNDYFGTPSERPTLSFQSAQVETFTNGPDSITVSGITISVPTNSITGGATQGNITARVNVTCTTTCTSFTVNALTQPAVTALPGGINLGTITASAATTPSATVKRVTITIPFTTTGPTSATDTIPTITVPLTVTNTITSAKTVSGSPAVQTTLLNAKAQAYRYGIFAHSFGGPSGQSETKGNDFVVTLGAGFSGSVAGHTGSVGSSVEQAGTYVHELGHMLNLQHGGAVSTNCKPNYPSVMSYSRQMDTYVGGTWTPSFSPGGHLSIAEGTSGAPLLPEAIGGDTNLLDGLASEIIVYGSPVVSPTSPTHATPDHSFHAVPGNAATIDWNDSDLGGVGSGTTYADINNFGFFGCQVTATTAFVDYIDRALFDFNFRNAPGGLFDGITVFEGEIDGKVRYQQNLLAGKFDGLDYVLGQTVSSIEEFETGQAAFVAGAPLSIRVDIRDQQNNPVDLTDLAFGNVFVSLNPNSGTTGLDPETQWVQITDNNPDNFGSKLMRWVPEISALELDWNTPLVEDTWYIRAVLYDPDNPDDDPDDGGLAGKKDDATGDFLIDNTPLHLPDDVKDKATMQVELKLPKTMKIEEFIPYLNTLKDTATKPATKLTLAGAIFTMQDSVNNNYWFDNLKLGSKFGHVALIDEGSSALGLELIAKGFFPYDGENPTVTQGAGNLAKVITVVDRVIVESAMDDALPGINTLWQDFWIARGAQEMLEAQEDVDEGDFTEAIVQYTKAWNAAQRARFNNMDDDSGPPVGTIGNDNLIGSLGNDDISGLQGKDIIQGNLGDDELFGGPDSDTLYGSLGSDYLSGEDAVDYIYGGFDNDWMRGGTGNDQMWGQDGDDFMYGDANDDKLYGGNGNDYLFGGAGKDYLNGGEGNDRIDGGTEVDTLLGDKGDDILISGGSKDIMDGGSGNDILVGSNSGIILKGGLGTDTCYKGTTDTTVGCEVILPLPAPPL